MNVKIRKLKKTEIVETYKLIHGIFPKADPRIGNEDIVLIAELDRKIVGFSHSKIASQRILLKGIGVLKEYRNRGIGKKLLEKTLAILSKSCLPIYLRVKNSNDVAISLYSKRGFVNKKYGEILVMIRYPAN